MITILTGGVFMLEENLFRLTEKYNLLMNVDEKDKEKFKRIVQWAGDMMSLSIKEKVVRDIFPKQGEVWTCDFGENVGCEINKVRPAIIVQNDKGNNNSPNTIVVPIRTKDKLLNTQVSLTNDDFDYVESSISGTALTEQVKSVSKARLGRRIGVLKKESYQRVHEALMLTLS